MKQQDKWDAWNENRAPVSHPGTSGSGSERLEMGMAFFKSFGNGNGNGNGNGI
jgi:hypothetical protein